MDETENMEKISQLAQWFDQYQARLRNIAALRMPALLYNRLSLDDIIQETWLTCVQRMNYIFSHEEIPAFIRLRSLLLQTLVDLERHHLFSQKRNLEREVRFDIPNDQFPKKLSGGHVEMDATNHRWNILADTMVSPRTMMANKEKFMLVHKVLHSIDPSDKLIIEMRNFENLSNTECAAVLDITPKAASIRYVRALNKLKVKLQELTSFPL